MDRNNGFGNITAFLQNCWREENWEGAQKIYNALSNRDTGALQNLLPTEAFFELEQHIQETATKEEALWLYRQAARRTLG